MAAADAKGGGSGAPGQVVTHRNLQLVRDPKVVNNRIYVGNLPVCTSDELESICFPYGKVLGSLVQKNFGFVQFESEELANKVASALNKSTFKGNTITVRNAGAGQQQMQAKKSAAGAGGSAIPTRQPDANDCEIIVVDRMNTDYAESIEDRLKLLNMRVDVLFPNSDVPMGKVLSSISSRGCLYAVLITNQHEEHKSITVNVLYGSTSEHRNMPVEDAIKFLANDFEKILQKEKTQSQAQSQSHLPNAVPIIPPGGLRAPPLKERHPDAMQHLLNMLANNLPLTVLQYDRITKYLNERRELQMKVELGEEANKLLPSGPPDPELELQKKILDIMSKPSVAATPNHLLYEKLDDMRADGRVMELLADVRVQRALDALMNTSLVNSVEMLMKF